MLWVFNSRRNTELISRSPKWVNILGKSWNSITIIRNRDSSCSEAELRTRYSAPSISISKIRSLPGDIDLQKSSIVTVSLELYVSKYSLEKWKRLWEVGGSATDASAR